jgi:hypothetical protein
MHLHFPTIVSESVNVTSCLRMRSLDRIFHCIQNWGFGFHAYNTCNQSSNFFPRNSCGCQLSGICAIVQLRLLEEKLQESEMRSRELEKQVVVCTSSSNTIFTWRTFEFCLPVLFQYIPIFGNLLKTRKEYLIYLSLNCFSGCFSWGGRFFGISS